MSVNTYSPLLVIGPSGSGKSTSLENLDPATTAILNIERKPLPFMGDFPLEVQINEAAQLKGIQFPKAVKDPAVKVIVIESFTEFCILHKKFCEKTKQGYDIFKAYAAGVFEFLQSIKNVKDKFVVVLSQDEYYDIIAADGALVSQRVAAILEGKAIRGKVEPNFATVAFTVVTGAGKTRKHNFTTYSDGITTAKAPKAMDMPELVDTDVDALLGRMATLWGLDYKTRGQRAS